MADELDLAILQAPEEGADVSELWSKAYPELRQLARARLRRSGRHSLLDTTGLVNEAYTRLAAIGRLQLDHRGQFFAYSARAMRSIILNLAREAQAARHGGGLLRVTLSPDIVDELRAEDDPLRIDDALCELAKVEPRLRRIGAHSRLHRDASAGSRRTPSADSVRRNCARHCMGIWTPSSPKRSSATRRIATDRLKRSQTT